MLALKAWGNVVLLKTIILKQELYIKSDNHLKSFIVKEKPILHVWQMIFFVICYFFHFI